MARTATYMAHGSQVVCLFNRPMTLPEARRRMANHVASLTSGLAITPHEDTERMIHDLAVAIREAEAHAPANDDGDFTPPPAARSAAPNALEIAA